MLCFPSAAQLQNENIIYIVDSIAVVDDPEEENEITQTDIAELNVIKNKDTLKMLGLEKFETAIFIFTKEYSKRPNEVRQIPSFKQMEKKGDTIYFKGFPYSGQFIDYYYSGKKQGEGTLLNGKVNGLHSIYYQNGKFLVERNYHDDLANGLEKEYYEDGALKQKGEFVNGKEEGFWEMYFPNGQIKQKSILKRGVIEGETITYYSTGKILSVELTENGKTTPDKRLEKISQLMAKSSQSNKEGDVKAAVKYCSKVIDLDSTYAGAYFSRGTIKLNNSGFDEAIADLDKALQFEPFMGGCFI